MTRQIVLSGVGTITHSESLSQCFTRGRPAVIGIAAAFVSITGVEQLVGILRRCRRPGCHLVAGTDNAVTHPEALRRKGKGGMFAWAHRHGNFSREAGRWWAVLHSHWDRQWFVLRICRFLELDERRAPYERRVRSARGL